MEVTEKCDVYSFGVLALEILMGTHPGELLTSLSSPSHQNMMLFEILDQRLPPPNRPVAQDVFFIATIAFACLHAKPKFRPTMKWVSQEFLSQKKPKMKPLHAVSLWQLRNQETYASSPKANKDWRSLFQNESNSSSQLQVFEPKRIDGKVVVQPPREAVDEGIANESKAWFLSVFVEVDLEAEFPREIEVDMGDGSSFLVGIEYPWIPMKCPKCNFFGYSAANCGNTEMVDPKMITKRRWVPKAKEVVDKVKADNKRGKQAQEKVPSPKVTPKPILSNIGVKQKEIKVKVKKLNVNLVCLVETRSNRQSEEEFVAKKLDRVLINQEWGSCFGHSAVEFLPPGISDHSAILVSMGGSKNYGPKPLKIFNYWCDHKDFLRWVEEAWDIEVSGTPMLKLYQKLEATKLLAIQKGRG
nr:mdis1-interacting receptor like kinase 2 [Quercus suber]